MGKTYRSFTLNTKLRKHPHTRGEDPLALVVILLSMETPPHAWGRRDLNEHNIKAFGNTPTRVGKTHQQGISENDQEKHPHTRGEDTTAMRKNLATRETPPHAWGRQHAIIQSIPYHRNTPTRVGKTIDNPISIIEHWKHPHTRGED